MCVVVLYRIGPLLVATPSEHLAITLAILGRDPIHLHEIILAHLRGNSYFDAGP